MKQLRVRVLVGMFAVVGVLSWAVARTWNEVGVLPAVPLAAPIVLGAIAAVLAATAIPLRARLREQRERIADARGVDPLLAARAAVFGQAAALVASLVAGVYAGMTAYLIASQLDIAPRREQAVYAGCSVIACAAIVAAGLWLQRIFRLPDDENGGGGGGAARA